MWWKAWSGKWTVSKLLAKELGYEIVSIGDMKRKLAAEMWINIIEFNKMWDDPEKSAEFDLKYEEYQKNLKLTDNIILDSRLGFYAQPKAFKILLDVDEEVAGERIFKAERDTDKLKMVEYMSDHIGEDFTGVISSITNWGMYVELPNTVEGLIHVNNMTDDYYYYDEEKYKMIGQESKKEFKLGQKIDVTVLGTDKERMTIDFVIKGMEGTSWAKSQ